MTIYDEMRNDIEVLYGGGACGYHVYSDMVDYIDEAETDYDRLKNENAKLRELCKKLYDFAWFEQPHDTELSFAEDMKELGIGVKEWK